MARYARSLLLVAAQRASDKTKSILRQHLYKAKRTKPNLIRVRFVDKLLDVLDAALGVGVLYHDS